MSNLVCLSVGGCPTFGAMLDGIEFIRKRRHKNDPELKEADRELPPLQIQQLPRIDVPVSSEAA